MLPKRGPLSAFQACREISGPGCVSYRSVGRRALRVCEPIIAGEDQTFGLAITMLSASPRFFSGSIENYRPATLVFLIVASVARPARAQAVVACLCRPSPDFLPRLVRPNRPDAGGRQVQGDTASMKVVDYGCVQYPRPMRGSRIRPALTACAFCQLTAGRGWLTTGIIPTRQHVR